MAGAGSVRRIPVDVGLVESIDQSIGNASSGMSKPVYAALAYVIEVILLLKNGPPIITPSRRTSELRQETKTRSFENFYGAPTYLCRPRLSRPPGPWALLVERWCFYIDRSIQHRLNPSNAPTNLN